MVALSVSPLSVDLLVVSADKSGVIVLWRFPEGAVRGDGITRVFATKEKWGIDSAVHCLKCSPYHEDEVAIGCVRKSRPSSSRIHLTAFAFFLCCVLACASRVVQVSERGGDCGRHQGRDRTAPPYRACRGDPCPVVAPATVCQTAGEKGEGRRWFIVAP